MKYLMESRERFVIEIVLAGIFIAFLVSLSIIIVNASQGSETETTITNSFNTYNYNVPAQTRYTTLMAKPYIVGDGNYVRIYDAGRIVYTRDDFKYADDERHLLYDSWSQLRIAEGLFGNDINNYEVYVQNREYAGGYFRVVFNFEDHYGNVDSNTETHYVGPREESRFVFKDISPDRYDYRRWWYEIKSLDKTNSFYIN